MNRMLRRSTPLLSMLLVSMSVMTARADDPEPAAAGQAEIDALIERIKGDGDQREPTEKLLKIGKPAVAPLAKAAEVDDAAVVTRCFDVLGRLLVSEDQDTAEAAKESLQKLSESKLDLVGRRARTTLRIKEVLRQREGLLKAGAQPVPVQGQNVTKVTATENGRTIQLQRAADGTFSGTIKEKVDGKEKVTPITAASEKELEEKFPDAHNAYQKQQQRVPRLGGAKIQINGQAIGGPGVNTVRVSIVNDKRHIEAVTGDDKVEITDTNGKNIELKHTHQVDGKSKTDEFKAADLDDLKKKHPEAAKLYERHVPALNGGFGGGIQLQIGGGVPVPIPGAPPVPGFAPDPFQAPKQAEGGRTIRAEVDDRRIEITETDGVKIRIKITKTVDGKDVSQELTADDLKTLQREHPEAAKLYQQLTGRF